MSSGLCQGDPLYEQALRILLECILVTTEVTQDFPGGTPTQGRQNIIRTHFPVNCMKTRQHCSRRRTADPLPPVYLSPCYVPLLPIYLPPVHTYPLPVYLSPGYTDPTRYLTPIGQRSPLDRDSHLRTETEDPNPVDRETPVKT